jgi:biotin synthesis protein BioG
METAWLHNNDRQNLIIFCNGWGMDGGPFRFLTSSDYDVYMLYDYRQLNMPDIAAIVGKYMHVHLVSWSMGVWAGQKLFSARAHLLDRTIAINGTLCPIDDRFGIPIEVFDATLAEFNEHARKKFYKRMCREKNNLNVFLNNQPQRSLEDQGQELIALRKWSIASQLTRRYIRKSLSRIKILSCQLSISCTIGRAYREGR